MYRDNLELATTELHNFILNHGALGDVICSLPAIIHARLSHHSKMKMRVWVQPWQMELVDHLLKPYGEFDIKDFTICPMKVAERTPENWDGGSVSLNQMPFNTHTRNRVHMIDYAFGCLIDARPENMAERSYPVLAPVGPRTIPVEYVVFPIGATSDNKLFRASVMAPIIEWVLSRGYKPVLVGTKTTGTYADLGGGKTEKLVIRDEVDKLPEGLLAQCLDWREKTTLLELRDVLGHAAAVVGVDGGTLHLAGTTDASIIFASGTTLPKHRYIARYGDPSHKIRYVGPRNLECAGCQSNWTMTSLDFRHCAYGDSKCMELLYPDDFINGLKQLGL